VADKLLRTADGAFPSARTWHIAKYGAGAWCVSGAFYGTSDDAVLPLVERMKAHLGQSGKARDVSHEEARANPVLQIHIDTFSGRPTRAELGLLIWASRRRDLLGTTVTADDRHDCQSASG
jgi:hypothetical protein